MSWAEVQSGWSEIQTPSGGGGGGTAVLATDIFTATAAQTDFVLSGVPLVTGLVYVAQNGLVTTGTAFTVSGSTVTITAGVAEGVTVQIGYWKTAPTGAAPAMEVFTATAGQTVFPLFHAVSYVVLVSVNGVVQSTTAWSVVDGNTIVFGVGLIVGDDVWVSYLY